MIANEAEIRVMLGLAETISEEERAAIALFHPEAEAKVIEHLQYDPEQQVRTEYYPRHGASRSEVWGQWDVNESHTHARLEAIAGHASQELQLQRLPIREIVAVNVDHNARHGSGSSAWGSGSAWVEGEDFWADWDEDKLSRSGILKANGIWPATAGTVRVQYRAGYSPAELAGRATASATAADGTITTQGINASGIKRAVILTVAKAMNTWGQMKKHGRAGFTGGVLQSEKMQDYSYALGGGSGVNLSGLVVELPSEAIDALEYYVNWGAMSL